METGVAQRKVRIMVSNGEDLVDVGQAEVVNFETISNSTFLDFGYDFSLKAWVPFTMGTTITAVG